MGEPEFRVGEIFDPPAFDIVALLEAMDLFMGDQPWRERAAAGRIDGLAIAEQHLGAVRCRKDRSDGVEVGRTALDDLHRTCAPGMVCHRKFP